MLILLKKTYTITVTVQEGNDEFWEGLRGKSGCDQVVEEVASCLADHGFRQPECFVRLERFEERAPIMPESFHRD